MGLVFLIGNIKQDAWMYRKLRLESPEFQPRNDTQGSNAAVILYELIYLIKKNRWGRIYRLVEFYDISNIVGYLMPNHIYIYILNIEELV